MPVVVTGASGFIGRHAVEAFVAVSPEVRAVVRRREAAPGLQSLGAKVAVGAMEDVDTLATVMLEAHTVCHLAGGLFLPNDDAYERANHASTRLAVEAARRAGVRRFLLLSYPGASPGSENRFLRSKGLAEAEVSASGLEHVVLRCTHVTGPGSPFVSAVRRAGSRLPALVFGSGRQVLAPVAVDDVVAVLLAADDRDRVESGLLALEGPDRVTADALSDLLGVRRRPRRHVGPDRTPRSAGLTSTAVDVLARDSVADAADAAARFGVSRTPLRRGLGID